MTLIKDYKLDGKDSPSESPVSNLQVKEEANPAGQEHHLDASVSVEQIKKKALARKLRSARALANRIQVMPDGSRVFIRFNPAQRREHQILIASFTTLAITGLLQHYSYLLPIGVIIDLLGGIETLRTFHHLAAIVLAAQSIYHLGLIANLWFVKREKGSMWPSFKDLRDLIQMVKFNLERSNERPQFDRFTVEEKIEYWALLWGTPLMAITGLMLWFPTLVTSTLPGEAVPIAQALHAWEAILATLAILIWHSYHTVIKERNRSIFTGVISEEAMQHEHPLEYQRILAAHKYLQKTGKTKTDREENVPSASPVQLKIAAEENSQEAL